ncbi:hypothetical protein E1B28_012870 [Marasmius oreades]|uniref:Uncharacterized protein n=1 Tax=Marasmius oreades TaxID=181124 RepID=A0A9P7RTH9_9AGAR|nr:uncharacterized protein E1B28_012870 [Marasmius oreades]KAG7088926.1 hypothetical protein E1B28_012870 [Marasmius oreades]
MPHFFPNATNSTFHNASFSNAQRDIINDVTNQHTNQIHDYNNTSNNYITITHNHHYCGHGEQAGARRSGDDKRPRSFLRRLIQRVFEYARLRREGQGVKDIGSRVAGAGNA